MPAGLTCCPLQLITPSWLWEGWPGVPSPLHPPSPSYYQIQPEGAECSVLTILTGKIGQVEPLVPPLPTPTTTPPPPSCTTTHARALSRNIYWICLTSCGLHSPHVASWSTYEEDDIGEYMSCTCSKTRNLNLLTPSPHPPPLTLSLFQSSPLSRVNLGCCSER